jgi:hypothetical protein
MIESSMQKAYTASRVGHFDQSLSHCSSLDRIKAGDKDGANWVLKYDLGFQPKGFRPSRVQDRISVGANMCEFIH